MIGICGFVLAAITFGLTRWERRRSLSVEFFTDWGKMFQDERGDKNEDPILVARIVNTGQQLMIIDRDSFEFFGDDRLVEWHQLDFFGRMDLPSPIAPGAKAEVGVYVSGFAFMLDAGPKDRIKLSLGFCDHSGRRYKSPKKYELLLEVDEVDRIG